MKINPYGNIQNIYKKSIEKQQPKADVSKKADKLEISTEAKLMQQETRISTERKEKVEQLKAQVQSGEYKVNPQEVAKKFYEFWNE
ncbi:flagellar biosynthesis anti-sigma factor FlgM [Anaerobacillus isosaccharinicus]|uniref:Negative regulator of flagellin synthesis n=1 Tax=Anaerobacillus isosaccharinicus TaxID=1532552 RepID=A0A1S2L9S9_9BACI|nr:flagellar biosynthesis anti-sigma factor FlgM [Anaerobacillus isosaccharinicus]MBA5584604.1 flagellar biosynthesis anti-sigma factor FlgM [Anaerobacillus isosaccharinicus]QOY37017.1 flagellar biosynthesis anti-sigma factor FlgM [Anaerobacillus isosaccharinicus]